MKAEEMLPDEANRIERNGVTIRKGSVGAFLCNARTWEDPQAALADRQAAERDIVDLLPALRALGLFEVLEVRSAALRALIEAAPPRSGAPAV